MPKNKQATSKEKGDILEKIVQELCSDYGKSKVTRNCIVKGKSGVDREIDVLIEAQHKSFDIKIVIESKNYSRKVDIDIVESFKTKLNDVSGNLGVIVCPLGFTEGARKSAEMYDIQLYQVFDHSLKNTTQFIPLRYIIPSIQSFSLHISHSSSGGGTFALPADTRTWRFWIGNKILDQEGLTIHAWNNRMFPQKSGEHVADFGVVKIASVDDVKKFFYLELKVHIIVTEDYYLKLFPASFMKNVVSGKGNHQLRVDAYSKKEDMIKNGWKSFNNHEQMEIEAKKHDTSPDMHGLSMTESYTLG